jgi:nucleotide-binding universal stress UspA family protein
MSAPPVATATAGFSRVVVAYDGSDRAEDALALALRLREPRAGRLTLGCVRVARLPWRLGDHAPPAAAGADATSAMLAEARHQVAAGIPVRVREVLATSPARGVTELAEADRADLVVVGSSTHGRPGRISTERTAGRMLHGGPCAVAVPPAGARDAGPFRHIGVAFDGSPESRVAVATAYALAARDGAAVTLVRALPNAGMPELIGAAAEREEWRRHLAVQQELEQLADDAPPGVNPRTVLRHGPACDVIRETCSDVVDLLVTGSRGYGPLQRAFIGTVSEALMEGAPHPVLVLPRAPAPAEAVAPPSPHAAAYAAG